MRVVGNANPMRVIDQYLKGLERFDGCSKKFAHRRSIDEKIALVANIIKFSGEREKGREIGARL